MRHAKHRRGRLIIRAVCLHVFFFFPQTRCFFPSERAAKEQEDRESRDDGQRESVK